MEFIEILFPLLVIIYFIFSFFKGLMTPDEDDLPPGQQSSESDEEAEARRIQEEIRRKIVARQQGQQPAQSGPSFEEGPPPLIVNQREEPKLSPEAGFRRDKGADERLRPGADAPPPRAQPSPSAGGNTMLEQLQAQKRRLEETRVDRRKAERDAAQSLRRSESRHQHQSWDIPTKRVRTAAGPISHYDIARELREDEGLRRAFIMREVLDRPLALRPLRDSYADLSR
ncbi:MAG: hypothetical protein JJT75_09665 [Opitutales bacterium]|nr:hypothetical protein [Opitutales bacterium]MCH8540990.1 hypothetical protein [Opitutales bacterium]